MRSRLSLLSPFGAALSLLVASVTSAQTATPTPASAPLWVSQANAATAQIRDSFGQSLAGGDRAFDIDLDGSGDLVVGAPTDRDPLNPGAPTGSFVILNGDNGAEIPIVDLATNSSVPTRRYGTTPNALFGFSLATRVDSGIYDIVIGAPGSSGGLNGSVNLTTLIPVGPFAYAVPTNFGSNGRVSGLFSNDQYGWSVVVGNFLSSPGLEIAVGAPQKIGGAITPNDNRSGYVQIINFSGQVLATVRGSSGGQPGDGFGYALQNVADRNGDGYDDLAVGAPYANNSVGRVEIIAFSPNPAGQYSSLLLRLINGPAASGAVVGSQFGWSLATAHTDLSTPRPEILLVGAPRGQALQGALQAGAVSAYALAGGLTALWTISNGLSFDKFGASIRGAGDVNVDGIEDFIVGAPGADNGGNNEAGTVALFTGAINGLGSSTAPTIRFVADDASANENLGMSVLNLQRQTPNNGALLDTVVGGGSMISGNTPGYTRSYENVTRPSVQRQLGAGCPRPGSALDLELTVSGATIGNTLTFVVRNAIPGQAIFLWGMYPRSTPYQTQINTRGCFSYLNPTLIDSSIVGVADAQGVFTHTVPILNSTAVIGATAHFQAFQVAPSSAGFSLMNVISSNGVAVTAGGF